MSSPKFSQIRKRLLRWYDQNRRHLPWRRTQDPYAIWIAETMLQQTQVKTVLRYYRRFLNAFPTLKALDRAPREQVLALWSGLGYYRRAENLKKAARKIVRQHGGKIPQKFDDLRALPGVGPYTAGALMSIAFNQSYPALDGNARRVLARLFNLQREKELWETAERLVSPSRPGHFNQALMELGARICLVRDPSCRVCPVARSCVARRSGRLDLRPPASAKPRTKAVEWPVVVIQDNGKILLHHRSQGGLLGGLWEIPGGERKKGESLKATLSRYLNGLDEQVSPPSFVGEIRHTITHRRIRAPVFVCSNYTKGLLPHARWRWSPLSSLNRIPLSSLSLKAVRLVTQR